MDLNRFDGIQLNPADPGALTPIAAAKRATATAASSLAPGRVAAIRLKGQRTMGYRLGYARHAPFEELPPHSHSRPCQGGGLLIAPAPAPA